MGTLALHEFHHQIGGRFHELHGMEAVSSYGDPAAEYQALRSTAGAIDLSFRSRICLLGADRKKFLHGQVTNQVNELATGSGCYAALVTAKGKMQSDLLIHCLEDELLLDFEPGLASAIAQRLERYIIADDVQVVDVGEPYGHLSLQGPAARSALDLLDLGIAAPAAACGSIHLAHPTLGDLYVVRQPRLGSEGFDFFAPAAALGALFDKLAAGARAVGGRAVGWDAFEVVRIEGTIPRFGADMDETTLPPEAGLESRAISYSKGCYIGQEVIARIRTYGQVARAIRGIHFPGAKAGAPARGEKLHWGGKEIGHITSACLSPALGGGVALAYLRREHNAPGDEVEVRSAEGTLAGVVRTVPFQPFGGVDTAPRN
ncbi:MAG TPA: hypothetical protein DCM86_00305 [Verrucomicrobiales bacterium]|nr:hypothetical protein [Verrucomicrobiales bacterium]